MRCMEMVPGDTACRGARGVSVKVTPDRAHGFRRPDHRGGTAREGCEPTVATASSRRGLGLGTSRAPAGLGCARPIFDPLGHLLFPPRDGAGADAHVGREKAAAHQGVERGEERGRPIRHMTSASRRGRNRMHMVTPHTKPCRARDVVSARLGSCDVPGGEPSVS